MIPDAAKNRTRAPLRPLDFPTLALSTGGLGFLRPAPGTWGSMPPPAILGLMVLLGASQTLLITTASVILALSCVICVIWGRYAEERFGRKDAAEVVIDETAGVAIAVIAAVAFGSHDMQVLAGLAMSFFAFRGFDIVKLWPANVLERLPHGWGVLLDDLAAGVYAAGAVVIAQIAIHQLGWLPAG